MNKQTFSKAVKPSLGTRIPRLKKKYPAKGNSKSPKPTVPTAKDHLKEKTIGDAKEALTPALSKKHLSSSKEASVGRLLYAYGNRPFAKQTFSHPSNGGGSTTAGKIRELLFS